MKPNRTIAHTPPDIEVVKFTPRVAAEWLARNTHNRTLREHKAGVYAIDMVNGDWNWTGDPIRRTPHGVVVDGQHRLRALVIAGETDPDIVIPFLVVTVDMDVQENIDTGIPRKLHDILKLRGESDAAALAALVRGVHAWQSGKRRSFDSGSPSTNTQILRTLDEYPELREVVKEARRIAERCDLPASLIGVLWWVFDQLDDPTASEDARFFFERLADGQGLHAGDPIYELSKTLNNLKADKRGERSRTYLLAITIKAWNAFRAGDQVLHLRFKSGGVKAEKFPEPR